MQIHKNDNVEVGQNGHKYALTDIKEGENVIKYGFPIGHATCDIFKGEHVHTLPHHGFLGPGMQGGPG